MIKLGKLYENQKRFEESKKCYKNILNYDSKNYSALIAFAEYYKTVKKYSLARKYFKKALKNRWKELRQSIFKTDMIQKTIKLYASEVSVAAENNFDKWHLLGKKEVWPNYYIGNTHEEEVDYLENWLLKRLQWLDKKWND